MPSREQVARALELIKKPGGDANYVRFFDRLNDPEWIAPLVEAGYFRSPPDPLTVGEGVAYPAWPETRYLLRIAQNAPDQVAGVLEQIPFNDNLRVHADLARIAARLPREAALRFANAESRWLAQRHYLGIDLPEAMAELVVHLAELGANRRAGELVSELIAVREPPGSQASWATRLESRMDPWAYRELVVPLARRLERLLGVAAIELFGDALAHSLALTSGSSPTDLSQIWRRNIADDSEHDIDDPRQVLITATREVGLLYADESKDKLDEVLAIYARYDWTVFARLSIDLLAERVKVGHDIAVDRTLDRATLNSVEVAREYVSLLRAVYPTLDETERQRWLALISKGPTWPDAAVREEKQISDEQHAGYVEGWRRNWYAQVREYLPDATVAELRRAEERYGPAQAPVAVGEIKTWAGPTSPLTAGQLSELTPLAIIEFVKNWSPSGEPMSPTPEGLGRLIAERVGAEPSGFAEAASDLAELPPTYVRAAIQGFEGATKGERAFRWAPVIELLERVMSNSAGAPQEEPDGVWDYDVGWSNARGASADLLRAGLGAETLPPEWGARAWRIIDALSWDREPTPEYESRYGGSNMDPLTLSLNTIRGKAMHAVIAYAVWRKQLADADRFSLAEEPDVARNLEAHLDPAREPSLTVRGVFGAGLATLLWLDREWLTEHLLEIFPTGVGTDRLRTAAWESYLSYGGHPYHLFGLLEDQYRLAVEGLTAEPPDRSKLGRDPGSVLAEHLTIFYYNGLVGLEEGGLLDRFVATASPPERAHLVEFMSRALYEADEKGAPSGAISRVTALWEWLVARTPADERDVVLAPFGWWYGASVLDNAWRTRELAHLLRTQVPVGPEFALLKALMRSASEDLDSTLEILYLYLQGERDHWRLIGMQDELRPILRMGANGTAHQREKTRDIINLLAVKGHVDLLDVVSGDEHAD